MSGRELDRLPPNQAGALYLEHSEQLTAFAWGLLRNRELAREVVQVTFGKALEHAGSIPPEGRKAWLFRVARNEALAIRRRDGVAQRAHERLARQGTAEAVTATDGDEERPDSQLLRREQLASIEEALQELPEAQRDVVRKKFFEDRTFAEIATETGCPLGTILTRMRLALGKLEQALKDSK